jgi:cell division protein FtsB
MTRNAGVGSLVKTATHKDMLDELRDLRRKNASLQRDNDKLRARVERMQQPQTRRKARPTGKRA